MPFRLVSTDVLSEDGPKIEKLDFYKKKLGEEKFEKMKDGITDWASKNGVPMYAYMHFLRLRAYYLLFTSTFKGFVSQTTRAHRLCQKAYQLGGQDLQIPLLKAIYKAHMEEGQDIAEIAVLADIADNAGTMSREKVNSSSDMM